MTTSVTELTWWHERRYGTGKVRPVRDTGRKGEFTIGREFKTEFRVVEAPLESVGSRNTGEGDSGAV